MERDCEAIRAAGKEKSHLLIDGTYVIDPDMFGPIKPFAVYCEFIENQGITKVGSGWIGGVDVWVDGWG